MFGRSLYSILYSSLLFSLTFRSLKILPPTHLSCHASCGSYPRRPRTDLCAPVDHSRRLGNAIDSLQHDVLSACSWIHSLSLTAHSRSTHNSAPSFRFQQQYWLLGGRTALHGRRTPQTLADCCCGVAKEHPGPLSPAPGPGCRMVRCWHHVVGGQMPRLGFASTG
jgi:hypothetical protein